jgi:hypothetical protein
MTDCPWGHDEIDHCYACGGCKECGCGCEPPDDLEDQFAAGVCLSCLMYWEDCTCKM